MIDDELGVLIVLAGTYVGNDRANVIRQQREKVLALIAPLEEVAAAARETVANHYGPFANIKKALAALDRPEDGQ